MCSQDAWTPQSQYVHVRPEHDVKRLPCPATYCGEQCFRFQHREKGEVTSVEEGQHVGRATVGLARRRYRGYDVSDGEAREGDHQTSASTPRMWRAMLYLPQLLLREIVGYDMVSHLKKSSLGRQGRAEDTQERVLALHTMRCARMVKASSEEGDDVVASLR